MGSLGLLSTLFYPESTNTSVLEKCKIKYFPIHYSFAVLDIVSLSFHPALIVKLDAPAPYVLVPIQHENDCD